ncbi:MAG: phosphoglucosamine mutase [Thermoplasmatota archaeon]
MATEELARIFRAYDVRGVVNTDLTPEVMARIGAAFGAHLGGDKRVCVARDVRTSSPMLERAFMAGLLSTGCDALSAGMLPIPTANFATLRMMFDAGAYITASHNPPEYNGVRFRHPDGTGYTHENEAVRDLFFGTRLRRADWRALGHLSEADPAELADQYIEFILDRVRVERPIRVALDPGSGASALTAPALFRKMGAQVAVINGEPDGQFPGRSPHPTGKNLGGLQALVRSSGAAFGAAYDGDGDRVVFVDELGRVAQVEKIGVIISKWLLRERKGRVIANVPCSMIVEEEIQKAGGEVMRVRVGDVFVSEAIRRHGALFAMEISAHYFLPTFWLFDDPVLTSVKLAEILSAEGAPLSRMLDAIPSYPMVERELACPDELKFRAVEALVERHRRRGDRMDLTDGLKVSYDDGWGMVRPSNTQPIIRLFAEARTGERVEEIATELEREFLEELASLRASADRP